MTNFGHVGAVVFFGGVSAMLDVMPPGDVSYIDQLGKLGAIGLLSVAVIVLWRKLQEKDGLLMANYKSMAEALATNKGVVEKMSDTLCEIKDAVEKLTTVRATLAELELRANKHRE